MAVSMMPKKTKRLYDRMQFGIQQKSDATKRLEAKRKALENNEESQPANNKGKQNKKARSK
jgi:hypothetical protein